MNVSPCRVECFLVPTLRVGMQSWTLCVLCGAAGTTRSEARRSHAKHRNGGNLDATIGCVYWTVSGACPAVLVDQRRRGKPYVTGKQRSHPLSHSRCSPGFPHLLNASEGMDLGAPATYCPRLSQCMYGFKGFFGISSNDCPFSSNGMYHRCSRALRICRSPSSRGKFVLPDRSGRQERPSTWMVPTFAEDDSTRSGIDPDPWTRGMIVMGEPTVPGSRLLRRDEARYRVTDTFPGDSTCPLHEKVNPGLIFRPT